MILPKNNNARKYLPIINNHTETLPHSHYFWNFRNRPWAGQSSLQLILHVFFCKLQYRLFNRDLRIFFVNFGANPCFFAFCRSVSKLWMSPFAFSTLRRQPSIFVISCNFSFAGSVGIPVQINYKNYPIG